MKKVLTVVIPVIFFHLAPAQSYSLDPNDSLLVTAPANQLSIFDIYQINTSGDTLYLEWNLVSMNIPAGWDFSLCDYATCYAGIPPSGTMNPVNASSMGFLGLNINPYALQGTANVRIYVYDAASPSSGDTLTWIVNSEPASVGEFSSNDKVKIFPNPVEDILSFSTDEKITAALVFGATGKMVMNISNPVAVDVSTLPAGMYSLVMTGEKGNRFSTRFIKK